MNRILPLERSVRKPVDPRLVRLAVLKLVIAAFLGFAAACARPSPEPVAPDVSTSPELLAGEKLTRQFYTGDLDSIWSRMTPRMREDAGGSLEGFRAFLRKVQELAGVETRIIGESVGQDSDLVVYRRTAVFSRMAEPLIVRWGWEEGGDIADFSIRPAAPAAGVVYATKTPLRLPFDGEWYVTAGGRTVEQNQHSLDFSNRFAYDMVRAADLDLAAAPGRNEGFATFGSPILAPGGGRVAAVRDGVPDNKPGEVNPDDDVRIGNYVSIDHGNGEFSVLGHLKRGSIQVAVGDSVQAGDIVGLAGNSGNSNGPHLHYNLQDRATPNRGQSLPAQFLHYTTDGDIVERGEPVQGQRIREACTAVSGPLECGQRR